MNFKITDMKNLKITEDLPNTKDWANTATRILRELINKHNRLVEEHTKLKNQLGK